MVALSLTSGSNSLARLLLFEGRLALACSLRRAPRRLERPEIRVVPPRGSLLALQRHGFEHAHTTTHNLKLMSIKNSSATTLAFLLPAMALTYLLTLKESSAQSVVQATQVPSRELPALLQAWGPSSVGGPGVIHENKPGGEFWWNITNPTGGEVWVTVYNCSLTGVSIDLVSNTLTHQNLFSLDGGQTKAFDVHVNPGEGLGWTSSAPGQDVDLAWSVKRY